jgi:urease accessory protein
MSLAPDLLRTRPLDAGEGGLEVDLVFGQSAATSVWAVNPLKVLVARPRGPSVWAYLSSFGGGLVAGDQTRMKLRVGQRSRCFLSTQSSTKVYRNPLDRPCSCEIRAQLEENSLLVMVPDPVQAFADSLYSQRQDFHLHPTAGLVLVDWFSAGRSACGERWEFTRYESRNEVWIGDERVFTDALRLSAEDGLMPGDHRLGRYNCFAMVTLLGVPLAETSARLLKAAAASPVVARPSLLSGASPLPHGSIFRFAGERTEDVGREIHQLLSFLPSLLDGDPLSRKW